MSLKCKGWDLKSAIDISNQPFYNSITLHFCSQKGIILNTECAVEFYYIQKQGFFVVVGFGWKKKVLNPLVGY